MAMRSPLGRVRGLGSANEGVGHWWAQRMTALALVPLTIWFVASIIALTGAEYGAARDWIGAPVPAGLLILLIIATFYHAMLGLQVVIEDYVHQEGAKLGLLIAVKASCLVLGLISLLSVLSILFGE